MDRPRALFDANLYLNLLLSHAPDDSAVGVMLRFAAESVFDLLLADEVVAELKEAVARRPYLASRISQVEVDAQFRRIAAFAIPLGPLNEEPPRISRDARDDYLLALAVLNGADYIVTRDKDLLDLVEVAHVRIVDPMAFLSLLRSLHSESGVD